MYCRGSDTLTELPSRVV